MDELNMKHKVHEQKNGARISKGQEMPDGAVEIPVEIVSDREEAEPEDCSPETDFQEQERPGCGTADCGQADEQPAESLDDQDDHVAHDDVEQQEQEPAAQAGQPQPEQPGQQGQKGSSWRWPWQKGDKQSGGSEPTVESLMAELESVKASCAEQLKAADEKIKNIQIRSLADFENYKKRLAREHDEHLKYAAEKVMKDLLPTLDNLELAINYGSKDEACANMMQGVQMTQKLLLDTVAKHGLTRVGQEGEPFDPAKHEAIGCESREEYEPETVARVLQSGYDLSGRLLRPAKVMVNRP